MRRRNRGRVPERTERQLAADVVVILIVHGVIDRRRWNGHQLAVTVGVSIEELDDAVRRHQTEGLDALMPGDGTFAVGQQPTRNEEHETRNEERDTRKPSAHPGERRCARCGEWFPLEEFARATAGDPRPLDGYRRKMCPVCFGEFERGHFIAVKHADALNEVVAFLTTEPPDEIVGDVCPHCDLPIEAGDDVEIVGVSRHVKCSRGRR